MSLTTQIISDVIYRNQTTLFSYVNSALVLAAGAIFCGWYCLDTKHKDAWFPGSIQYCRIVSGRVAEDTSVWFSHLCGWAIENTTDQTKSSEHWWYTELPPTIQSMFDKCINTSYIQERMRDELFDEAMYSIVPIREMDELYVTGPPRETKSHSDRVFFIPHIDGPFSWLPYVSVYRCMVSLNRNDNIMTEFLMAEKKYTLTNGEFVAFDFNREIHMIREKELYSSTAAASPPRICAKVHYCIFPKGWESYGLWCAQWNVWYNKRFRELFLHTINPITLQEWIASLQVVYSTYAFVYSDMWIGHRNMVYLFALWNCPFEKSTIHFILFATVIYKQTNLINVNCDNMDCIEFRSFLRDSILYFGVWLMSVFLFS
jgi:hypothetical protein